MNRFRRMNVSLVTAATLVAAVTLSTSAREDRVPATAPSTAPTSGWFGGAPAAKPANPAEGESDAAIFARLWPELAKADPAVRAATPRILFDGMGSRGKPDLKMPLMSVAGGFFTEASRREFESRKDADPFIQIPDERRARIAAVEARQRNASICLDIESLPMDERYKTTVEDTDRSVRLIAQIVGWQRQQDPNLRIFLYACFPLAENYVGINRFVSATTKPDGPMYGWWKACWPKFEKERDAWVNANARLTRHPNPGEPQNKTVLSDLFDGTCPSLYLYPNVGMTDLVVGIPAVVREQVNEARRYGKPVYPFVWYMLCDTNEPVPLQQWTTLMREVLKYADGAVLWDGPTVWNNRLALRVRIAILIADRKGEMTDAEIYDAVRATYPNDKEIEDLRAVPSVSAQPIPKATQQTP